MHTRVLLILTNVNTQIASQTPNIPLELEKDLFDKSPEYRRRKWLRWGKARWPTKPAKLNQDLYIQGSNVDRHFDDFVNDFDLRDLHSLLYLVGFLHRLNTAFH